jgi:hypothetical protein
MSDREKAGLRGLVRQCTEEETIPAFQNIPAATYTTITRYTPDGRILQSTTSNSVESAPPEFSTTYTYDSTGCLLKKTIASPGSPATESKYNYDEKGRIIGITGDPLGISSFEYDDTRLKIRTVSSPSEPVEPQGTSYMFPMPEDEDSYLPIPTGGHAKISFNEQEQPVEWRISDANGSLTNRLIRTYDENGRVAEMRYTIENYVFSLPAEAQQEFLAEPDAVEKITKGLTELLGEQLNFIRITYGYDADGRLIEKHQYTGHSLESTTKISYNDHSDKLEEREFTTGDPNPPRSPQAGEASSDAPLPQRESETQYSYKYDTFGNWTEQTTSSSVNPSYVSVTRRTIGYY